MFKFIAYKLVQGFGAIESVIVFCGTVRIGPRDYCILQNDYNFSHFNIVLKMAKMFSQKYNAIMRIPVGLNPLNIIYPNE